MHREFIDVVRALLLADPPLRLGTIVHVKFPPETWNAEVRKLLRMASELTGTTLTPLTWAYELDADNWRLFTCRVAAHTHELDLDAKLHAFTEHIDNRLREKGIVHA